MTSVSLCGKQGLISSACCPLGFIPVGSGHLLLLISLEKLYHFIRGVCSASECPQAFGCVAGWVLILSELESALGTGTASAWIYWALFEGSVQGQPARESVEMPLLEDLLRQDREERTGVFDCCTVWHMPHIAEVWKLVNINIPQAGWLVLWALWE